MRLSVCCRTAAPAERIEALVEPLRGAAGVVLEVVVGCPAGSAERYAALAARVVELSPEASAGDLRAAATGGWTLELSDLELPSAALVARLPALLGESEVDAYALPRRWSYPDANHWLDELGWWPDFGVRLRRQGTEAPSPDRLAHSDAPLYHLDCLLNARADRQAEAIVLDARSPGMLAPGGGPLTGLFEPERFSERAPARAPDADARAIGTVLAAAGRPSAAAPPAEPESAGAPSLASLESDLRFAPGERREVVFVVRSEEEPAGAALLARGAPGPTESRVPLGPGRGDVVWVELAAPDAEGRAAVEVELEGSGEAPVVRLELDVWTRPPAPTRREGRAAPPPRGLARLRRRRLAIPRLRHRIWLGDAPLPDDYHRFEVGWARLHPGWESHLWTEADAPSPPGIERARTHAERADLIRYEVLRRHGGVYCDTDVEWLRPVDELLAGVQAFAAYEIPGRLCNAVIGAVPGHPAFVRAVELAERTVGTGVYPSATATTFLTGILERDASATLFGPERFYPYLWDEERRPATEFPQAYAVHRWAKSWLEAPGPGR